MRQLDITAMTVISLSIKIYMKTEKYLFNEYSVILLLHIGRYVITYQSIIGVIILILCLLS